MHETASPRIVSLGPIGMKMAQSSGACGKQVQEHATGQTELLSENPHQGMSTTMYSAPGVEATQWFTSIFTVPPVRVDSQLLYPHTPAPLMPA